MTMPLVTLSVAHTLFHSGQPFKVRLENRISRQAYWQITFDPVIARDTVEIRYGRISSKGQAVRKSWSEAVSKCHDKMRGDYEYANGSSHTAPPPTRTPKPTPKPTIHLVGPYAEIRTLKQVSPNRYMALDGNGLHLLDLDSEGADQVLSADSFRIKVEAMAS